MILESPEYRRLLSIERGLRGQMKKMPDFNLETAYQRARQQRKTYYATQYSQASKRFRLEFLQSVDSQEMRKQIDEGKLGNPKKIVDELLLEFEFVSPTLFPDRHYIAKCVWASPGDPSVGPMPQLINNIRTMCDPTSFVLYYPSESPVDGCCPVCDREMMELPAAIRPSHIHSCIGQKHKQDHDFRFKENCPNECNWGNGSSKFDAKRGFLQKEFGSELMDPNAKRKARAKESKRLHDQRRRGKINRSSLQCKFQNRKSMSCHFLRHIRGSTQCMWDNCGKEFSSEGCLRRHLLQQHQLNLRQAAFASRFCYQHPLLGWFLDEFSWEIHCKLHIEEIPTCLKLIKAYGAVLSGMQCPYCLGLDGNSASERFTQFDHRFVFNRHVTSHEKKMSGEMRIPCPTGCCGQISLYNLSELQTHLFDVHSLSPRGYTRSLGYDNQKPTLDDDLESIVEYKRIYLKRTAKTIGKIWILLMR
jgi:hypothetical protein